MAESQNRRKTKGAGALEAAKEAGPKPTQQKSERAGQWKPLRLQRPAEPKKTAPKARRGSGCSARGAGGESFA